jgi:hypothetical protein
MKLVIIFMILLMAAAICSQGQERVNRTGELIRGLESKLTVAMLQGDSTLVDRILADDYIEVNAQGLLRRKVDLMAFVRARAAAPQAKSVGPEVTIDETNLRMHGDTAVLIGRITTRYQFMDYQTFPDTPQTAAPTNTIQERFMKVYSKRDGRWQLVASTTTAIAKQ